MVYAKGGWFGLADGGHTLRHYALPETDYFPQFSSQDSLCSPAGEGLAVEMDLDEGALALFVSLGPAISLLEF